MAVRSKSLHPFSPGLAGLNLSETTRRIADARTAGQFQRFVRPDFMNRTAENQARMNDHQRSINNGVRKG